MQTQNRNRSQEQKPNFMVIMWGGIAILLSLWLGLITDCLTVALPMGLAGSLLTAIITENLTGRRAKRWSAPVKRRRRF